MSNHNGKKYYKKIDMENQGIEIQNVEIADDNIVIKYMNDAIETLPNNSQTYKQFYDLWLRNNPPFISDIFKTEMRNITLVSINDNGKCVTDLQQFFNVGNEDRMKKFFTYMRNREGTLPAQKAMWKVVS